MQEMSANRINSAISRRGLLSGSVGAAVLMASPDRFSATRAPLTSPLPGKASSRAFFIYGVVGSPVPAVSAVQSGRRSLLPRAVSLRPVASQLAALPVMSPDQTAIAVLNVDDSNTDLFMLTATVIDTTSLETIAHGTLTIPKPHLNASLSVTPVFAADSATVALVLCISTPTETHTGSKRYSLTGRTFAVHSSNRTSQHALAYFNSRLQRFTGPFDLSDGPSMPLVTAAANASSLFLWTVKDTTTPPSKHHSAPPGVPELSLYPLYSGRATFSVPAPGPWPGGEPTITLADGGIARLINAREVLVYSAQTGNSVNVRMPALRTQMAKPSAPMMQSYPGGKVLIADPAAGRAVIADPTGSLQVRSVIYFPPPLWPRGGALSKVALSLSGDTLYAVGPRTGGLSAYEVATGRLVASYSHGEHYTGVYQLPGGAVLAVAAANPRLAWFTPSLGPLGTADTPLQVVTVY